MFAVGLVEEFFFRTILQTRLSAYFKSEVAGVVLMAIIFGLAHAPGLIFRGAGEVERLGTSPSVLDSIAYTLVIMSTAGLFFWHHLGTNKKLICGDDNSCCDGLAS